MPDAEPFGHECHFACEHNAVVGLELARTLAAVDLDAQQRVQGIAIERIDIAGRAQRREILARAEILEQHEAASCIARLHVRHVHLTALEQRGDTQVRTNVLFLRRRIHGDQARAVGAPEAEIASKARVRGSRLEAHELQAQLMAQPVLQLFESWIVAAHGDHYGAADHYNDCT